MGLPIGLQISGPPGGETVLLQLAYAFRAGNRLAQAPAADIDRRRTSDLTDGGLNAPRVSRGRCHKSLSFGAVRSNPVSQLCF